MRKKKITALIAVLTMMTFIFAGCSSTAKNTDSQPTATAVPTAAETAPEDKNEAAAVTEAAREEAAEPEQAEPVQGETQPAEAEQEENISAGDYSFEEVDGGICLTSYQGSEARVSVPAEINGRPVTEIGESCFAGSLSLREVVLPEGVTSIGDYAFECCSYLHKAYLPASLKTIGNGAFSGCVELTLVDTQEGIESIGDGAFLFCRKLPAIEFTDSLTQMGQFAFAWCEALSYCNIEQTGLTEIPDRAFYQCGALQHAKFSDKVTRIGLRAFEDCKGLKEVYLPDNIQEVKSYAFAGCENMESANMPCEVFEANVFSGCGSLSNINLGKNVRKICANTFSLTGVTFLMLPASVTEIEPGFMEDSLVDNIYIPEGAAFVMEDDKLYTADMSTLIAVLPNSEGGDEYTEDEYTEDDYTEDGYSEDGYSEDGYSEDGYSEDGQTEDGQTEDGQTEDSYTEDGQTEDGQTEDGQAAEGLLTIDEIIAQFPEYAAYRNVPNDRFDEWAKEYVAANSQIVEPDSYHNNYISMYKGEYVPHYVGMTATLNQDADMIAKAKLIFGDDFEPMYIMMDHGLQTEINRFYMPCDMVLFTGVYDSQLRAAVGSEETPSLEEVKACVGNTFSDPIMTSTTVDPAVAKDFSDTMFIIFAGKESLDSLGCVCMDAYMHSNENEILLNKNAQYKILDAGSMLVKWNDWDGSEQSCVEQYVVVELLGK